MTVASIIDPARFLDEHLVQASPDLLREMLTTFINALLSADADSVCGAAYGAACRSRGPSGRQDSNLRPPAPKAGALAKLSYAP